MRGFFPFRGEIRIPLPGYGRIGGSCLNADAGLAPLGIMKWKFPIAVTDATASGDQMQMTLCADQKEHQLQSNNYIRE